MNKKQTGFSLIEVMIAMAVLAILTSIALPAYQEQVRTGKRTEAQNLLLETASKQQRFFSDNMTYAANMGFLGYGAAGNNAQPTDTGSYTVGVTPVGTGYTLTATALNDQVNDGCINLTLTNTGVKGKSGSKTLANCWK